MYLCEFEVKVKDPDRELIFSLLWKVEVSTFLCVLVLFFVFLSLCSSGF